MTNECGLRFYDPGSIIVSPGQVGGPRQFGGNTEMILPPNFLFVGGSLATPDAITCQRVCQLVSILVFSTFVQI